MANTVDCASVDIRGILPHGEDFRMVDRLLSWSLEVTETELLIAEGNCFVSDGRFSVGGLVENMAQTSAARIGYYYRYVLNKPISIGFIGALQNIRICRLPETGEVIRTRIEVKAEAFGMVSFDARITDGNGGLIAEGQMKTAL